MPWPGLQDHDDPRPRRQRRGSAQAQLRPRHDRARRRLVRRHHLRAPLGRDGATSPRSSMSPPGRSWAGPWSTTCAPNGQGPHPVGVGMPVGDEDVSPMEKGLGVGGSKRLRVRKGLFWADNLPAQSLSRDRRRCSPGSVGRSVLVHAFVHARAITTWTRPDELGLSGRRAWSRNRRSDVKSQVRVTSARRAGSDF